MTRDKGSEMRLAIYPDKFAGDLCLIAFGLLLNLMFQAFCFLSRSSIDVADSFFLCPWLFEYVHCSRVKSVLSGICLRYGEVVLFFMIVVTLLWPVPKSELLRSMGFWPQIRENLVLWLSSNPSPVVLQVFPALNCNFATTLN